MSEPTWFDDEPDSTGVRILLGALPDPGPMPDAVVGRIEAALAEAGRRAGLDEQAGADELIAELGGGSADVGADSGGPGLGRVGRFGNGRVGRFGNGRRRWVALGAAAASLAALGLAGGLLNATLRGGGSLTTSAARVESAAGAKAADARQSAVAAPQAAGAPAGASDNRATTGPEATSQRGSGPRIHVESSSRSYLRNSLARTAQDMLDQPGAERASVGDPALGALGTSAGVIECVTTLGAGESESVSVDLASFDGAPAAIIVVDDGGLRQVFAVQRSCGKGDPGLLYGPVPMP